jgi:2-pyrone-4,6-dicarboxylate lactonase
MVPDRLRNIRFRGTAENDHEISKNKDLMSSQIRKCVAPDRNPRPPSFTVPAGSIDTHVHVFESSYLLSPNRGYTPPDSTLEDLQHLHSALGVDRVVFTQPSVYGTDNSAILDGMRTLNAETEGRARAVIATGLDISDEDLAALDADGVRGVRLNTDNIGGMPVEMSQIPDLCARIAPFGWHVEFLFAGKDIIRLMPLFAALTVPMSIGHFAYQPATGGVKTPNFQALLELMRRGNTWMKISGANRVSATDLPPYDDVAPMATALIEAAPDRIMWGTDWPHPNKYEINPNDGDLLDTIGQWVSDEAMRQQIMVDTPADYYRF